MPGGVSQIREVAAALTAVAKERSMTTILVGHVTKDGSVAGPRTLEHLEGQLPALDVTLTPDVLDRVDAIVAPGVTLNDADAGWASPALTDPALRRR